jgi:hypothetical protein
VPLIKRVLKGIIIQNYRFFAADEVIFFKLIWPSGIQAIDFAMMDDPFALALCGRLH